MRLAAIATAVAIAVLAGALSCGSSGSTSAASGPAFGVLSSTCDADRLAAERKAGLTAVAVTAEWGKFEPSPGLVDDGYAQALRARVDRCRDAGMTVSLGLGIQYAPQWVRELDSGTFLNQNSDPSPAGEPNIIFSAAVRVAAAGYFRKLAAVVDLSSVSALRIGTSDSGEQGFPESLGKNYFWAFDRAAQSGFGIASGMARTPLEGWTPGQPTWHGRPVGKAEVAAWYSWYAESSTSAAIWQMEQLDAAGFRGEYHLPTSGKGVSAKEVDEAAGALLTKPVDSDGALSRGLEYPVQFATLAKTQQRYGRARIVIDVTSIDDSTAVVGRGSSERPDRCTDADPAAADTEPARSWSNQRWTIAAARAEGLSVWGENPGAPGRPSTGGTTNSDGLADQLPLAVSYAELCHLDGLLFAFENDLFQPGSGVTLDQYGSLVSEHTR